MSNADCYFFHGDKAKQFLHEPTITALDIAADDIIVIWHMGDVFFACNPRLEDGSGLVLSYYDLKTMVIRCFNDNSFRKGTAELK